MLNISSKYRLTALSLSLLSFSGFAMPPADCGPGPHWIDSCAGGPNGFRIAQKVQIRIPCDRETAPTIILKGPTRYFLSPGNPITHTMDYEVRSGKLKGQGIVLRAGIKQGVTPTEGQFIELADPQFAQYSADYSFEIDILPLGITWHTEETCRMEGVVDRVPPSLSQTLPPAEHPCYVDGIPEVTLYDENNEEVGCLVTGGLE